MRNHLRKNHLRGPAPEARGVALTRSQAV